MPRRSIAFQENAYYHIYNKGIQNIHLFIDQQDLNAFQNSLAYYLVPFNERPVDILARTGLAYTGTFSERITLFAFALLPDSFHLLIRQSDHNAIVKFMQRVGTAYSMYYNKKYERRGTIFEGRFRTKHVDTDDYLLESSKYIHRLGLNQTNEAGTFNGSRDQSAEQSPAKDPGMAESASTAASDPNPSPLSSLRFMLKSAQNSLDPDSPTQQSNHGAMGQSDSKHIQSVTSYQRYLNQSDPSYQPLPAQVSGSTQAQPEASQESLAGKPYIDQAVKPDHILHHLGVTHPGLSYRDYIEGSPNIEWYLSLLSWLQ